MKPIPDEFLLDLREIEVDIRFPDAPSDGAIWVRTHNGWLVEALK